VLDSCIALKLDNETKLNNERIHLYLKHLCFSCLYFFHHINISHKLIIYIFWTMIFFIKNNMALKK